MCAVTVPVGVASGVDGVHPFRRKIGRGGLTEAINLLARNEERTEAAVTWMDDAVCQAAVLFVVCDWQQWSVAGA